MRVKNLRPQYDNLREWMENPRNVYIGRGGRIFIDGVPFAYKSSIFANPYKPKDCKDMDDCLEKYEIHLRKLLENPVINEEFKRLKSRNLGCWCAPDRCHGDVISRILKEEY